MKRAIYTILIMAFVCSAIVWAAGNKDFTFNLGDFTIPFDPNDPNDYTLAEKRLFYLTALPVPTDPNGAEIMTEKQWFIQNCRAAVERHMALWMNRGRAQIEAREAIRAGKVFSD